MLYVVSNVTSDIFDNSRSKRPSLPLPPIHHISLPILLLIWQVSIYIMADTTHSLYPSLVPISVPIRLRVPVHESLLSSPYIYILGSRSRWGLR